MQKADRHAEGSSQPSATETAPPEVRNATQAVPVTALGLTGYLFIGTAAVLIPSVMPFITDEYMATGLTLTAIGVIFPARAVGGILGNLLAGVGSDRFGYNKLVWMAALALAASLALAAAARLWLLFIAGFVLISIAQASLSTSINAMIADANRASRARALNVLHGVYGVGATISPLVIGFILERGAPWRWTLAATGLIWLVYGGGALLLYRTVWRSLTPTRAVLPARHVVPELYRTVWRSLTPTSGHLATGRPGSTAGESKREQGLDWGMLRNVGFLSLFLIAFIYNGVAFSLLGWVAVFMKESVGLSTFYSTSTVAVFYVALTAGRFICAAFAERLGYVKTLLILTTILILTYPLVVFSTDPIPLMVGVFLTGLSLSGLFPTALAYGTRLYPQHSGAVTGMLNVAMTAGAMLPPLWTGLFADIWSFQSALGINYSMAWLLLAVCLFLGRTELRARQPQQ